MTVITIVLIGVVAAVAIPMVNSAMKKAEFNGNCQACGGFVYEGNCFNGDNVEINVYSCQPGGNS